MAKQNDYSVIYSDEDIVVLNKRSGLLIAADRYNPDEPRLDLLAEVLYNIARNGGVK